MKDGSMEHRHPGNANITFEYIEGEAVLLLLNYSICVLAGALGVFAILKAAFSGAF